MGCGCIRFEIFYHPEKRNMNTGALLRSPPPKVGAEETPFGIVSAVTIEGNACVLINDHDTLQRENPDKSSNHLSGDWCIARKKKNC